MDYDKNLTDPGDRPASFDVLMSVQCKYFKNVIQAAERFSELLQEIVTTMGHFRSLYLATEPTLHLHVSLGRSYHAVVYHRSTSKATVQLLQIAFATAALEVSHPNPMQGFCCAFRHLTI